MDDTSRTFQLALNPADRTLHLLNAFVQDEITIAPDRLKFVLGTKIERNDFTGVEVQPNARLLWTPHAHHSLWASVSHAVRTPARGEVDLSGRLPGPVPFPPGSYLDVAGNPGLRAEELTAYELGYRLQPHKSLSADLTLFYNDYDRLRIPVPGTPVPGFPFVLPFGFGNEMRGETYGAELEATWQAASWWRLQGSYTFLEAQLHRAAGLPANTEDAEDESPHHQFQFRSTFDLPKNFEFNASLRYVDRLATYNQPGYLALDLQLGWHPQKNVELSFGVRNLLDDRHPEFSPDSFVPTQQTEVPRSFYGKITFRF
ncbi:MAG: TonB-dependent receptor [Pedosphaera sp.]|nr:TonB-dependent receptor [Pedosphaera sp.]